MLVSLPVSLPPSDCQSFILQQDAWIQETMQTAHHNDITDAIGNIDKATQLIAVSDGSVGDTHRSCGWVLNDGDNEMATGNWQWTMQ